MQYNRELRMPQWTDLRVYMSWGVQPPRRIYPDNKSRYGSIMPTSRLTVDEARRAAIGLANYGSIIPLNPTFHYGFREECGILGSYSQAQWRLAQAIQLLRI